MLAESSAPHGSWDLVLNGMGKLSSGYTENFLCFWKVTDLYSFVTGGMGRTALQGKALTNWPQTVSTGWYSAEEQLYRVLTPHNPTVAGRGGRVMTKQMLSRREVLLCHHPWAASPQGITGSPRAPSWRHLHQTTTGLHFPGLGCILGALEIISIAAWMFAAMADSFLPLQQQD